MPKICDCSKCDFCKEMKQTTDAYWKDVNKYFEDVNKTFDNIKLPAIPPLPLFPKCFNTKTEENKDSCKKEEPLKQEKNILFDILLELRESNRMQRQNSLRQINIESSLKLISFFVSIITIILGSATLICLLIKLG